MRSCLCLGGTEPILWMRPAGGPWVDIGFSITSSDKDKMRSMSEGFYFSDRPLCALQNTRETWDRTLLTQVAKQRRKLISSRLRTWNTAPSSSLKIVSMIEGVLLEHMLSSMMFMPHRPANIISTRVVKSPPSDRSAVMSVFFLTPSRNDASSLVAQG